VTSIRHIAAMPLFALALAFWAAGMALAKLSDISGTAATKVMGPCRR
jgi:hypothetical protein